MAVQYWSWFARVWSRLRAFTLPAVSFFVAGEVLSRSGEVGRSCSSIHSGTNSTVNMYCCILYAFSEPAGAGPSRVAPSPPCVSGPFSGGVFLSSHLWFAFLSVSSVAGCRCFRRFFSLVPVCGAMLCHRRESRGVHDGFVHGWIVSENEARPARFPGVVSVRFCIEIIGDERVVFAGGLIVRRWYSSWSAAASAHKRERRCREDGSSR